MSQTVPSQEQKNDWKLSHISHGVDVATSEASTEAYPSISKTVPLPFVIISKMQFCKAKTELKNFAVVFEKHLLLPFPNLMRSSNIRVTAMVLDLRQKNVLLSEDESNNAKMKALQFFNDGEVFVLSSTPIEEETNDENLSKMFERAKKQKLFSRLGQIEDSFDIFDNGWNTYLAEPVINRTNCPLRWLNGNKRRFPELGWRAFGLLVIPATAVPIERLLSETVNLYTARRGSLASETYRELVVLRRCLE